MSKAKRRKFDFYPSASWMVEQLLTHYPLIGGVVLEPCSGDLDIVKVLRKEPGIEAVVTNDLDHNRDAEYHENATNQTVYDVDEFDWIVTNPPFSEAMEILQRAHQNTLRGCAFLLRLSFLEPTLDRGPWLAENPPTAIIVLPRYSFTGDGKTDSVTAAWMVWDKEAKGQEIHISPRRQS